MTKAYQVSLFVLIVFFLSGCAEIANPPGGPEDKTSPHIIATIPLNGAVNVPVDNEIIIEFTERIVRPTQGGVYISPRPIKEPDISWKSDKVIITLADSFTVNQTYLVTLGSEIKDLRNNRMDSSVTLAFSTGEVIDSGKVSGKIFSLENQATTNMLVGLFNPEQLSGSQPVDSIYPAYLTSTNNNGEFTFQYLPPAEFYLLGYQDKNKDEKFNPAKEMFALPDRKVDLRRQNQFSELLLPLNFEDTSLAQILAVSITKDNLIKVRLNRVISLSHLKTQRHPITLRSPDNPNDTVKETYLLERHLDEAQTIHFYAGQLKDSLYFMTLYYDSLQPPLIFERVNNIQVDDDINPRLVHFTPAGFPQTQDELEISLLFSEPIAVDNIQPDDFFLLTSDSKSVPVSYVTPTPFYFEITAEEISPVQSYTLLINESAIEDIAGNAWGDSLYELPFSILSPDSLGAISGSVNRNGIDTSVVTIVFTHILSGQKFNLSVSNDVFTMEVPAGKYILEGYLDKNLDNRYTPGSFYENRLSEPYMYHSDTVTVRARFETAGITIEFK